MSLHQIQILFTLFSTPLTGRYQSLISASQTPARKGSWPPTVSLAIDSGRAQTRAYRSKQSRPVPGTEL